MYFYVNRRVVPFLFLNSQKGLDKELVKLLL